MASPKVAAEIGSRLGEVVEVERRKSQDTQNFFMRVKVALPTAKPLRRGAFLRGLEGQRTWVSFKYERLPLFCHCCGLLGHDIRHCATFFALKKDRKEGACQYGDWLKANGGRNRSPPRTKPVEQGHQFGESEGVRADNGGRQEDDGLVDQREAEIKGQTKPVTVTHGIHPDLVGVGGATEGPIKESNHVPITVTTTAGIESAIVNVPVSVEPKLVEANLNMSCAAHVVTKDHAVNYTEHHILAKVVEEDGFEWWLTCFYGWPEASQKKKSWALLSHLSTLVRGP
ncbi:hypothetical protein CFP56_038489 [Quercus suber]|uniref:Zinc knuckle CX2CX4HX4C domain-containing protein n=1 Tax=Quercus suber TaxID=58331 RepID=A0AAW0J218_QUESU